MPSPYLIEPGAVVVPARIAAALERELHLDEMRARWRGLDAELDAVLLAWHVAAVTWADAQRSSAQVPMLAKCPELGGKLSADDVAVLSGCSARAVRKAAAAGRLAGHQVAGCWQFSPEEVAAWRARRRRGENR